MAEFRYAQFCPLARATEILGERWTLLVVRELLLGPKRFADLRGPLAGISSSVLADRLLRLEERGLVARRRLPAPASALVYELTSTGRALLPVVVELVRWGLRFLAPPRAGDRIEPHWVRLGLMACARRNAAPARRFNVTLPDSDGDVAFHVAGGPHGTVVHESPSEADASIRGAPLVLLGMAAGSIDPRDAIRSGALRARGDVDALVDFPALFDMPIPHPNQIGA